MPFYSIQYIVKGHWPRDFETNGTSASDKLFDLYTYDDRSINIGRVLSEQLFGWSSKLIPVRAIWNPWDPFFFVHVHNITGIVMLGVHDSHIIDKT